MTTEETRETFGQATPSGKQLSPMAGAIASGIGHGQPAPWAGFVWYRPEGLFQQNLHREVSELLRQVA